METLQVNSSTHSYNIVIGEDIRLNLNEYLPKTYSAIFIITDEVVADLYLEDIKNNFKQENVFQAIIPVGEKSKHVDWYYQLQTKALEYGLDRHSLIIALGGGVVGDLAGFVAATYLRGVDYIQIPTTILAHDSSVGGKVAINHELGKNLIGSFYPPKGVIFDVNTLETLPEAEVRSGYAELIKEALIANQDFFERLIKHSLKDLTPDLLKEYLYDGIKVKAAIVEEDEKESGIRMYLNLGHTLAHAIEAELGYGKITHGEAVAIGLLFALQLSEDQYSVKLPIEPLFTWLKENEYPLSTHLKELDPQKLIERMKLDKKVVNQKIQMVLLKEIGQPIVEEVNDKDLDHHLQLFIEKLVK